MTGGMLRVLRAGMAQPLTYPLSENDTTLLSYRQARILAFIGLTAMLISTAAWVGLAVR